MIERLDQLERNLAVLEEIKRDRVRSRRDEWALRYGLLESIQIVIDVACAIAAQAGVGTPSTYGECVDVLVRAKVLDEALGSSVRAMVGLRNLLVHEYDEIDTARLLPYLDRLNDFRSFAAAVAEWSQE